jgi:3-oxoacyl-[acyl-carrier protein] reductase
VNLNLQGRRALITGGSKGIGLAIAEELVAEGADVAICARNPAEVEAAAEKLRASGRTIHAEVADVTDPQQVIDFVEQSAAALGGIDILVNNAGAAHPGNFESLADEDWQGDLDVKLFSQVRCTRAALPHLRRSAAPRVININSVYAKYPTRSSSPPPSIAQPASTSARRSPRSTARRRFWSTVSTSASW